MEKLIGRKKEKEELLRCYQSERSEFVILYGRRRIGKTFLVNQVFGKLFSFQFIGSHKASKERQLERFALCLQEQGGCSLTPNINSWYHAFDALQELLSKKRTKGKKVVFFDEMPWIDTYGSDFVAALEDFWNCWAALRDDIMLVACGSATSWMVDKLVENQGGLHGRITSRIYLRPFNLFETEQYLRSRSCLWNRYTIAQCYMYLGGTPYYLSLLDCKKELSANLDDLFFLKHAKLDREFSELYNVLFKDADRYVEIVRLLAKHREGMTRKELTNATKSNGGTLTKRIENLMRCDFIIGTPQFNSKKKGTVYRLADFFTMFYFKYVEGRPKSNKSYWQTMENSRSLISWQGLTFELLAITHVEQIIAKLGIAGVHTNIYTWRSRQTEKPIDKQKADEKVNTQIDLVIERSDNYIYLCEMKFSLEEYVIDKDYEKKLRTRMSIFREETHTRKALLPTFVTTYGVKPGIHSGIMQHQVFLEDLFLP